MNKKISLQSEDLQISENMSLLPNVSYPSFTLLKVSLANR